MKSGEQQGQMGKKEDEVFLHFFLALEKIVAAKYNVCFT
jgi:hypothetical protein